ncbi:uncharacterized protein LOC144881940 isoform X1 [Branchiostoma floridae x Branchiostoma japonicum]
MSYWLWCIDNDSKKQNTARKKHSEVAFSKMSFSRRTTLPAINADIRDSFHFTLALGQDELEDVSKTDEDWYEVFGPQREQMEALQNYQKKIRQKDGNRFKHLVQRMIVSSRWIKEAAYHSQELTRRNILSRKMSQDNLDFNLNDFRAPRSNKAFAGVSAKECDLLKKHPWLRTPADVDILAKVVQRIKIFERHSPAMKRAIARFMQYESFGNGRVIIEQGTPGISLYIMVSGTVQVVLTETDPRGKTTSRVVGMLRRGQCFGELALMHDTKRNSSIIVKGKAELVRLDKDDFELARKMTRKHELAERLQALLKHDAFKDWSEHELHLAMTRCSVEEYPPNSVIFGGVGGLIEEVFFVVSGECRIVRRMAFLERTHPDGTKALAMAPKKNSGYQLKPYEKIVSRYLQVRMLKEGELFGLGQQLKSIFYLSGSVTSVKILRVDRALLYRHDNGLTLGRLEFRTQGMIPSKVETFTTFMQSRLWKKFKEKVLREVLERKRINKTRKMS